MAARTEAERLFEQRVRLALKRADEASVYTLDLVQRQLRAYRNDIIATLAPITKWDAHYYRQVSAALEESRMAAARQMAGTWYAQADKAMAIALAGVDDPLFAIGLPTVMMPAAPVQQLAILNNYVPELIVDVTKDVHKQVRRLMSQAMMGGISGKYLLKQVGNVVGPLKPGRRPAGTVFSSASVRARTIMRTEMNRLHNIATTQRTREVAEKYPGVGSKWIHRSSPEPRSQHSAMHGKVIYPGQGQKFDLGGYRCAGPHDPSLPAKHTINCHCTTIVTFDADENVTASAGSPYDAPAGAPSVGAETPREKKVPAVRVGSAGR